MQQISTKESVPSNEEYMLGEQHSMGKLKAAYYVTYTNADKHHYITYIIFFIFVMIGATGACMLLLFSIFDWFEMQHISGYLSYLSIAFNLITVFYSLRVRNKWGNRPLIGPRTRHLRIYVYQEGLIKQTDKQSEVVRWSEITGVTYIPYVAPQPKSGLQQTKTAGIKIKMSNNHEIKISGAIEHVDELAELLKYIRNTSNSITV